MKDAYDNYGHDMNTQDRNVNLVELNDDILLGTDEQLMPLQGNKPGNLAIVDRDVKSNMDFVQTE